MAVSSKPWKDIYSLHADSRAHTRGLAWIKSCNWNSGRRIEYFYDFTINLMIFFIVIIIFLGNDQLRI